MSEKGLGAQNILRSGVDGNHPLSYAETPGGLLLMANGCDPMLKWDGLSPAATTAGVAPPLAAVELGGVNLGRITGRLVAYQRFLDASGNASDLSPVSNAMDAGSDGLIDRVGYDSATGVVMVTSPDHGLATGTVILIDGIEGLVLANGVRTITAVDKDRFAIQGLVITGGAYTQGGCWTLGVETVVYGGVEVPTEPKVVRRQILRNLSGNLDTLYVDIDTDDLESTAFVSTATDETLAAGEAVPMFYGDDDLPYANRHGLPPSHKTVVVSHKGRMFATADGVYAEGHAEARFNSKLVQGVGTHWRAGFAGRLMYLDGATQTYQIASVNEVTQVATLTAPFLEAPRPYTLYSIKPDPGERRLVYYTEPGLPESWPSYNAIAIPEASDTIVGCTSLGQYLYVIERRHIHRVTFQADPSDGMAFLSAQRGSVNNRTYAITDLGMFMLDEIGIHQFDGNESKPISMPIQNVFQGDGTNDFEVDWTADQTLWHAAHDPVRDTVRWFVQMRGSDDIYHAITYNYRTERWGIEQYPTPMRSSTCATLGSRRSLAGTAGRRIVCLSEGNYDGVDGSGTLRGHPTSADSTSLTDALASFSDLEGAPLSVIDGTGKGQQRIVASNTATVIQVDQAWDTTPDASSVYQVGGIAWIWRSGWFRYIDSEAETPRDIDVVFRPIPIPGVLDVQLYYDHSATPRVWCRDIKQDGVETTSGSPVIAIDLDNSVGWARQRISAHGNAYAFADTFVSVELSGVQAGAPVRISQIAIAGVES